MRRAGATPLSLKVHPLCLQYAELDYCLLPDQMAFHELLILLLFLAAGGQIYSLQLELLIKTFPYSVRFDPFLPFMAQALGNDSLKEFSENLAKSQALYKHELDT